MSRPGGARPLWLPFFSIAAAVVVADQLTKAWIRSILAPGEATPVLGDWIRLVHAQNNGGIFGLLRGQALPFAVVSLGVIALIVAYHGRSGRSPFLTLALAFLLGGAIGNLFDRLRYGYVIDFVDAGIGGLRWYTFNVADASISLAIVLLLALSIRPSLGGPVAEPGPWRGATPEPTSGSEPGPAPDPGVAAVAHAQGKPDEQS
ncbi:MAG TPA: signal peptidase II [Candidatus Eisenbacteria bacterium]|nr:signal peptidase II [Candidatus Eisenbacteria bacterium]